jgi:hypothetical protein
MDTIWARDICYVLRSDQGIFLAIAVNSGRIIIVSKTLQDESRFLFPQMIFRIKYHSIEILNLDDAIF